MTVCLPLLVGVVTPAGCSDARPAASDRTYLWHNATGALQVKHVVVLWLKKPGDPAGRRALIDAGREIRKIPGVVDVSAGECVPSDRKVVDSTYDVAYVITFEDPDFLKAYGQHPTHQRLLKDVLGPLVERYVVYDFKAR